MTRITSTIFEYKQSARLKALIAGVLLTFSGAAFGQTVNLKLSSGSAAPGSTVPLTLSYVSNGNQASSLEWTLSYSPGDFSGVAVTAGAASSGAGKAIDCLSAGSGVYKCLVSGMNATRISDGVVATANFTVSPSTGSNSAPIQVASPAAASPAGDAIAGTGTGAAVTITRSSAALSGLGCSPSAVQGGSPSQCTVTLSSAAGSGGFPVSLGYSSSSAGVTMPSSITIPAGNATGAFTMQTSSVSASTTVTVNATANSVTKTASVTVNPTTTTDNTPPSISAVSSAPGSTTAVISWTTNEASNSGVDFGTSASSLSQAASDGAVVTAHRVTLTGLTAGTNHYFRVRSSDATGNSAVSPGMSVSPASFTTTGSATAQPTSFWPSTAIPKVIEDGDSGEVEVGLKFYTDVDGTVTGVRFYKGANNTGTHTGTLWTSSGTKLGAVTFTNETSSGWQKATFASPIAVKANTTYIISYHATRGRYSVDEAYFDANARHNPPVHIPGGSSGVYRYGPTGFPTLTYNRSNYWVDVIFLP